MRTDGQTWQSLITILRTRLKTNMVTWTNLKESFAVWRQPSSGPVASRTTVRIVTVMLTCSVADDSLLPGELQAASRTLYTPDGNLRFLSNNWAPFLYPPWPANFCTFSPICSIVCTCETGSCGVAWPWKITPWRLPIRLWVGQPWFNTAAGASLSHIHRLKWWERES